MRKLPNWIESFFNYAESLPSPALFKKWAAIATIAGALERKVWVRTSIGTLYPNLYTILVAPPGVGKTILTSIIWSFWNELSDGTSSGLHIAPSSVTSAALIEDLKDATRKVIRLTEAQNMVEFNSLAVCSNELGVLLPEYANEFMAVLTDLYDCKPYGQRRKTGNINFKIEAPQLNLIASCTPGYLAGTMPEGAWDMGFLSRTLLIFSNESVKRSLFTEVPMQKKLRADLEHDLKTIFNLYGKITFTEAAATMIDRWQLAGGPPVPDHPKLANYNTRRTAHIIKLAMVCCAATTDDLIVTEHHVDAALTYLLEAEQLMPDIFKAMAIGGDAKAMKECWHFVYSIFMKENKPIIEARIIDFLRERVPVQNVMRILEVMEKGGLLIEVATGDVWKSYKPRPPKAN